MEVLIRQETTNDYAAVADLIERAFRQEEMSDHQEQFLVERLRQAPAFLPELSLVAVADGQIVGHILLSKIMIEDSATTTPSLALAPVSVLPAFQQKRIGSRLMEAGHERARQLGFGSVILLGHATYYPRFGYRPTATFGIELPFPAPPENCLALELQPGALADKKGKVIYPPAFFGDSTEAEE